MRLASLAFVLIGLLALPVFAFAHGGEKHEDNGTMGITDHDAMDMSAMDHSTMQSNDSGGNEYGTESGALPSLGTEDDLLGLGTAPLQMEPSANMKKSMDHSGHDAEMKHIELAEHEMVSTDSKGYGLAVGVTVLSGLAFGFLMLVRPLE